MFERYSEGEDWPMTPTQYGLAISVMFLFGMFMGFKLGLLFCGGIG